MPFEPAPASDDKIKVFLSYSRTDTAFALDLVAGLQACGFEAFIDQEDIAPGEPWEARLGNLIESADTVVYVLSPDSLTSTQCSWEVDETLRLNKRLLPVVWRDVAEYEVPANLSQLNYTYFSGKNTYAQGLRELSNALRIDYAWIRDHTRIGSMARRWDQRGRTDALLLRGEELEAASAWAARRPASAPDLSDTQVDFIAASKAAHDAAERAARNRRRGLLLAVSGVALVTTALAGFAVLQWQQADEAKTLAQDAYTTLAQTNDELQAAYLRLSSDIALRAPPTGTEAFSAQGGWFPVAANYAGAIVRLQQRGETTRQIITGFMIDGALVHPDFAGETLLLSPQFQDETSLLAQDSRLNAFLEATDAGGAEGASEFAGEEFTRAQIIPDEQFSKAAIIPTGPALLEQRGLITDVTDAAEPGEVTVTFPALGSGQVYPLDVAPIWRTPIELAAEPQFQISRLSFEPPFGTRSLQRDDLDCARQYQPSAAGERYALFGIDGAFTLAEVDESLTLLITDALERPESGPVTYRHATLKGAFGAPLFDLDTRKVIGIHLGVEFNALGPNGRVGYAEPLAPLIDRVRDQVSIDRGDANRTPPLCLTQE